MKKALALFAAVIIASAITACSSSESNTASTASSITNTSSTSSKPNPADKIVQQIKDDRKKWNKLVDSELPSIAKEKDKEKMINKLNTTISWCDKESDYFLAAADTKGISDKQKQACLDIKTGLYGAESSCFKPMLKVFKGSSSSVPENYNEYLGTATDYIKKAYDAVKWD